MMDDSFSELMRNGEVPLSSEGASSPTQRREGGAALLLPDINSGGANEMQGEFCRSGFADRDLKKLRNGQIDHSIDLHGMTVIQAHAELNESLSTALRNGWRTIEVIHGRGNHSDGDGILRNKTRFWLQNCKMVLAYVEPSKNDGAVIVRLKKR